MVKKTLLTLFVIWLALLMFMPKKDLYFTLERELSTQGIVLNEARIEEGLFSLDVEGVTVFYKGIEVAQAESLHFFTLLFYSKVQLKNLLLDAALSGVAPRQTEEVMISYILLSPMTIHLQAMGDFGLAEGKVDLSSRTLRIDLIDPKEIRMIRGLLHKDEKGWYYETSF